MTTLIIVIYVSEPWNVIQIVHQKGGGGGGGGVWE